MADDDSFVYLDRYRAGDEQALHELLRLYQPRVELLVRLRMGKALRERMEVQDVVQNVFVRFLRSAKTIERRSNAGLIDVVAKMALNEIRSLVRDNNAKKRGGGKGANVPLHTDSASHWELAAEITNVDSAVARRELAGMLEDCIEELAESQRQVVELYNYVGYDWATIAEIMGRSREACQELYRRAKRELGELMRRRTDADGSG